MPIKQRYVGIDVSAKTVMVVFKQDGNCSVAKEFLNTAQGHQSLIRYLRTKRYAVCVCLEATGIYHFDLAVRLFDTKNIKVMVVNPKQVKHFAKARAERNKTDAIDARIIAEYAELMPFVEWERPSDNYLALRSIARRLCQIKSMRRQSKCQLHAASSSEHTVVEVLDSINNMIVFYDREIKLLEGRALMVLKQDSEMKRCFDLFMTIKGIGEISALHLVSELFTLPKDLTAKQWVAFAGLDPTIKQSGTSVHPAARISRAGNKYLRSALFYPALTAIRYDKYVRGYYYHMLNDQKLKKLQAIVAVMRKLLHAMHGMARTNTSYDSTRFYKTPYNKEVNIDDVVVLEAA